MEQGHTEIIETQKLLHQQKQLQEQRRKKHQKARKEGLPAHRLVHPTSQNSYVASVIQVPTAIDEQAVLPEDRLRQDSNGSLNDSAGSNQEAQPFLLIRRSNSGYGSTGTLSTGGYTYSMSEQSIHTIRFQVVIWNVGKLDVVAGTVPMTFRVSLFWNDPLDPEEDFYEASGTIDEETISHHNMHVWKMHGRNRAFQQEVKDMPARAIQVPPLSIMNVTTFTTVGSPDIDMLNDSTRLMRWTCMYRATVVQDNLRVDAFPHDSHNIALKLAILSNRGSGKTWDRRIWKLALATFEDTQHSTRVPHGLIVDQARIPGFSFSEERGLHFKFHDLNHGIFDQRHAEGEKTDQYLKVSLNVLRESGYYDNNILPILALMNVVAISVLTFDDTEFFYRALITLNIAFVQMGIRMSTDNHLPTVDYEIRLQKILNEFFVVLMILVLEAMTVYVMRTYYHIPGEWTKTIDWITGILAVLHNLRLTVAYYVSKQRAKHRLEHGWKPKAEKIL